MLNGKNWQTLVVGVAAYGREREQLKELDRLLGSGSDSLNPNRLENAAWNIVREFLGMPDDTAVETLYEAWFALSEAFAAQKQLAIMVARLEALCVAHSSDREAS